MNLNLEYHVMFHEFYPRIPSYVLRIFHENTKLCFMNFTLEYHLLFYEFYPRRSSYVLGILCFTNVILEEQVIFCEFYPTITSYSYEFYPRRPRRKKYELYPKYIDLCFT